MPDISLIRLPIFLGLFLLLALLEARRPRRALHWSQSRRWITNWTFSLLNTATLFLGSMLLPLLAVGAAFHADALDWGLFHLVALPFWFEVLLTLLLFDFTLWLQHLITHKVPPLWRLHRVHHADPDIDVSTAIRFHPLEIAFSLMVKIALVYALGAAAIAVLAFEILLNATALFTHANLRLPPRVDALLRRVVVTPDMHRVHHSVHRCEHDSNYGFALSVWDRTLGTYVPQPQQGHTNMTIGLEWQNARPTQTIWSLMLPFRRK